MAIQSLYTKWLEHLLSKSFTMIFFSKFEWQITGDSLRKEVESLPDGRYQLEITSLDTRSLRQNSFLWGWVYPHIAKLFAEQGTQLTDEQIHEYYKYLFLRKKKKCPITKRLRWKDWSTTKLSKKWFKEYLEKIDRDCVEKFKTTVPYHKDIEEFF